jgi:hypothetical protein
VVVTPAAFSFTIANPEPPGELAAPLAALWWTKKGDWDKAHRLVQDEEGADAAWVHAYLHRFDGDLGNARYWYARARQPAASGDLDAEWTAMVATLLERAG